jgi:7-carboxy-7-deazaguanine synthase
MFGKNPLRPKEHDTGYLAVESIFYTLQGEGPYSGRPCLFIRLSGCNLACHFCDTDFEKNVENYLSVDAIMSRIKAVHRPEHRELVVITGGEPLRQDIGKLCEALLANGTQTIQIETAGTLWQDSLEPFLLSQQVVLVCSPKTPKVNYNLQRWCEHWKYVVADGETDPVFGLPNRGTQVATKDTEQPIYRALVGTIWLSPRDDYDDRKNVANKAHARNLCLQHGYRLSLQVHKLVGVE